MQMTVVTTGLPLCVPCSSELKSPWIPSLAEGSSVGPEAWHPRHCLLQRQKAPRRPHHFHPHTRLCRVERKRLPCVTRRRRTAAARVHLAVVQPPLTTGVGAQGSDLGSLKLRGSASRHRPGTSAEPRGGGRQEEPRDHRVPEHMVGSEGHDEATGVRTLSREGGGGQVPRDQLTGRRPRHRGRAQ